MGRNAHFRQTVLVYESHCLPEQINITAFVLGALHGHICYNETTAQWSKTYNSPALIISSKFNCSLAILNYWLLDHDDVKCRYNFLWRCIVESTAVLSLLLCGCVRSWCMCVFVDSCGGCARFFFSFMFIWWDTSNHNLFISADWLVQPSCHNTMQSCMRCCWFLHGKFLSSVRLLWLVWKRLACYYGAFRQHNSKLQCLHG